MDASIPAGSPVVPFAPGDIVRLRKPHPCGGREWTVSRIGADVGLLCRTCGRRVLLDRRDLERRLVTRIPAAEAAPGDAPVSDAARPHGGPGR